MSERRACRAIGCCRMTMRCEAVRQDDPVLRERLRELARVRRRFGYPLAGRCLTVNACIHLTANGLHAITVRRRHVFLRREGHEVNHKRLLRICREERPHLRRRPDESVPSARGPRWLCRSCPTSAGRSTSCRTR